jgi:Glyoxalase-like domain
VAWTFASSVCVDTADPAWLAGFWQAALGGWRCMHETVTRRSCWSRLQVAVGTESCPDLLFLRVPEVKVGKNRLHLDLLPKDQAAEVARLEGLGARRADGGQGADVNWVLMADPDGNEFCVLRPLTPQQRGEG